MKELPSKEQASAEIRPRSNLRLQLLLSLGLAILVFGGLEVVLRVYETRKFGSGSLHSIALRDRFTAWRNNPAYGRVDRRINAQGFRRDRAISIDKPPNTIRIFLTGGSVAYGFTTGWPDIETRVDRLYGNQTISYYMEEKLNRTFPFKRWEVINAAVVGYQLNLELAQTESVLLRYHPDAIVYLDGYNDLLSLLRRPGGSYDPYASTPTGGEFELLANPGSFRSLVFFATVWMRENSALFRKLVESIQPNEERPPSDAGEASQVAGEIRLTSLNLAERRAFYWAQSQLEFYPRFARQINRIVNLDQAKTIFLLQPELFLTHKTLTATERRLLDRVRNNPALFLYAFQELYPEIGAKMTAAAGQDGFAFLNLIDVFDKTAEQTFTDDCHLTPEGNRIVADRVSELIVNSLFAKASAAE